MAKGLTSSPLTIWVSEDLYAHPAVLALMAQGHKVLRLSLPGADLILAPQAHMMSEAMLDYLPAALTAARARKRSKA